MGRTYSNSWAAFIILDGKCVVVVVSYIVATCGRFFIGESANLEKFHFRVRTQKRGAIARAPRVYLRLKLITWNFPTPSPVNPRA